MGLLIFSNIYFYHHYQILVSMRYCSLVYVGRFNLKNVILHLLIHLLKLYSILLQLHEFLFQIVQIVHCLAQTVNHVMARLPHLIDFGLQFFHFLHLFHHLFLFLLSLFLKLFSLLNLSLSFQFLLLLFLNLHDSVIHFHQKMRKFRIDFVHKIWKICGRFVINVLEKHYSRKIFREVLNLVWRKLSLKNVDDLLLLSCFNLFSKMDNFFFDVNKTLNIFTNSWYSQWIIADYLSTNSLDFYVRSWGNFINKISDCEFSTFR